MAALDPKKPTPNKFVHLLNSTRLGDSLARLRLERQMNRAGRRKYPGHLGHLTYLPLRSRDPSQPPRPLPFSVFYWPLATVHWQLPLIRRKPGKPGKPGTATY